MKVKDQVDLIFDLFDGCPRKEIVSSVDLLLQREGPYSRIIEEKEQSSVRAQNNSIERLFILKSSCHQREETIILGKQRAFGKCNIQE